MKRRQLLALSLMVGLLLVPLAAGAESHEEGPKPLTWLSYVKAQTGKGNALGQHIAESGKKIYDGLMADGHVITWGVAQPINHRAGDDWTHMEWVTFRDWAAVDTFIQGFMAMQMAKSPEELQAEQEEWLSLIEPGSHYDEILRHQVVMPAEGVRPAYFDLSYHQPQPGQYETLVGLWKEYAQPTMAKLQEEGTIGAFGIASPTVHDGTGASVVFWTALPSLAAQDAVNAAFEAADEARGEEAQKELMEKFRSAVDLSAHHDRIVVVTHYGGGDGGEGGDDG